MVAVIAVVAFTLTLNIGNVYAIFPESLIISPSPVLVGTTTITVTGNGFVPGDGGNVQLKMGSVVSDGSGGFLCSGTAVSSQYFTGMVDGSGHFVVSGISISGLSVGTYCVRAFTFDNSFNDATVLTISPATTTTTTTIPEYPFGLAVLAIFMIIAYGVIRRRTRN